MNHSELTQRLQSLPFTANFSASMLQELAALAQVRTFARGQFIFHEGEVQRELFLVTRGYVVLEMCVPAGLCTRLLTIGPGELLAWSAILGEGKMTANAICQEDVELIALDGCALLKLCERDPAFGFRFMQQVALSLSKRLLGTRLQLLDMFAPPISAE
jgi:CRP-like cAMP-binding protein